MENIKAFKNYQIKSIKCNLIQRKAKIKIYVNDVKLKNKDGLREVLTKTQKANDQLWISTKINNQP